MIEEAVHGWLSTYERLVNSQNFFSPYLTQEDLSRLGRNYIEAGSYIEIFFPKHNVRYIAIADGVDSLTRQEMDITPFKNILNDMYSRDISKKVLSGITIRSKRGKFCGGTPPLGLMRDPEDKGHLMHCCFFGANAR